MPFQRCTALSVMIANERARQRVAAFLSPTRELFDINTVVLHEALRHVDFTIDNEPPIRVLCDPMAHKRIDVPEIKPQVSRPLSRNVERRNHVTRSIPALLIHHAFSSSPQATAQSQIAHTCQRIQDGDIALALRCTDALIVKEERIILMLRFEQYDFASSSTL